jgi:hypothetical protein
MGLQGDLGHLRNQPADSETIRTHRQILMGKHVFQLHSVHHGKDPLQQGLGHFESDEIVVLLRGVTILRDLHRVEPDSVFKCAVLSCAYRTDLPNLARSLGYSIATAWLTAG